MNKAPYNPQETEKKIYRLWERSGFFNPDKLPKTYKKPFTVLMPPPNANDPLHIGHAVFVSVQDLMIRYNRLQGKRTLWLPGTDHAGFETQVVYEKKLEKQNRSRLEMTREEFYKEVLAYTLKNKKIVKQQLQKLGASCDWSRETFTLDKHIIKTTYQTFKKMADEGLIYRGERLVNYCIKHRTAFSDLETEKVEKQSPLYYIKYGPLVLATTRPETKFGDTAVAVYPQDKRYKKYIGQEITIKTLIGERKIKVIADKSVDPDFGTGAVKVTPACDFNDFEIWQKNKKHMPEPIKVINEKGQLTSACGKYQGLKIAEAREKIVSDMKEAGLIEKIDENYKHFVTVCYKCKNILEPILMEQWFVKTKPLAKLAIEAVEKKNIVINPKNYEKIYFHWMKNIKDWNISRQNWWGISIPAWRCKCLPDKWIITDGKKPNKCKKCKKELERDTDVFDTWFSSGQWPFATLRFPNHKDFKNFYPTSVLETGYDILFFWVARMIMLSLYRTKKAPFKYVYLNGLVRDKDRQKMSKSKGNVIDPLDVTNQYGTDALRLALIAGNTPGRDIIISEEKIKGYRNFNNKLWNIAKFIFLNSKDFKKQKLCKQDQKILTEFKKTALKTTKYMNAFKYAHGLEAIYHYVWHVFADKIIEESKFLLQTKRRASRQNLLMLILKDILILLHPFAPFITEDLYQKITKYLPTKKVLMIEKWPQ